MTNEKNEVNETITTITTTKKKPGRPKGHKLSTESKERIRLARLGKKHSTETKEKISNSMTKYHEEKDND